MQLIFTGKQRESGDVWSFMFTPAEPFTWEAGQSLRVEVEGAYGPLEHRFSISSAPSSGKVTFTTRLSDSDYKEGLAALQPGDEAQAYGLEGDFTWCAATLPHIFVAAGIGITPFFSMLTERAQQSWPLNATLIYGSRDDPPVFKGHLDALAKKYPELGVQYVPGRVHAGNVLALPHAVQRIIYISGPSKMAGTIRADLIAAGIAPAHILTDQFTGRLPLDG